MSKKIKQSIIFIVSFCIFIGVISGCGINNKTTDTTTNYETNNDTSVKDDPVEMVETTEMETETTIKPVDEMINIKLSFTGDMMLASYKNEYEKNNFRDMAETKEHTYFLAKVKHIFENDDFTIVNLENVITDQVLSPVSKNHSPAYWYYAPTSNLDILTLSGVECVSLENNHSNDYGEKGFKDTVDAVEKANLFYGTDTKTMYIEKDGFKIAVICCGLWGSWQTDSIIKRVNEASDNSDYQIIYFHGGTERLHKPEDWKVNACHKIVDAGADLVIGGHPHVLQPKEIYKDVEIIYSLGNFCYGGNRYPENRTIIYQVELNVNKTNKTVEFKSNIIPCYVYTGERNNYQPDIILNEEHKNTVFSFMDGKTDLPY